MRYALTNQQMSSVTHVFANSSPEISSKVTGWPESIMSETILSTRSRSYCSSSGGNGGLFEAVLEEVLLFVVLAVLVEEKARLRED